MILQAEDIHKNFGDLKVLRGVSLQIKERETVAIMGKSGEGKSTLLHIFGTLDPPSDGVLRICGKAVAKHRIAYLRNRHIGFIFQSYHLLEDFTVLDNVLMPLKIGRQENVESKEFAHSLLKEVGLEGKANVLAKYLSGGEKQRVAIARALCNKPDLLLADEPTGNLDQSYSHDIQKLLLDSAKKHGKALILVTHDEEFARSCDRLLFLNEGQLYNPSA
ncbi:MAG: Lipoprotein-releasing system ATP-binding protein LolD [Chlamydiae bacterium]|nr:Lipoprotein-releasing system ATP-binding protein LolD [Chlamydiota bacterium]